TVVAVDPLVDDAGIPTAVSLVDCDRRQLAAADLIIVLTDHDAIDWLLVDEYAEHALDTRNRLTDPVVDRL
ncbi:MAG: nucleotide sugar dehydrogenase, partial [Pseudonocardiales bacterium]|nr:nucleotide sugar dehydrogenase [Pseudonocardiales bacterium]